MAGRLLTDDDRPAVAFVEVRLSDCAEELLARSLDLLEAAETGDVDLRTELAAEKLRAVVGEHEGEL